MNVCSNPLDPSQIEALASGETPAGSPAAEHAARCVSCGQAVHRAEGLGGLLGDATFSPPAPPDLADRVLRIRPFSRAERRSLAIWRAPLLLLLGLSTTGTAMVAGLAGGREQIGLAAAMLGSLAGLLRACVRWLLDVSRSAPAGLDALGQALRPTSAGWVALLLLLPVVFALRKVLARASARR